MGASGASAGQTASGPWTVSPAIPKASLVTLTTGLVILKTPVKLR